MTDAFYWYRKARALTAELRQHKAAYDRLVVQHARTVHALNVEEQRSATVALLLADGVCLRCDVAEQERDAALHDVEGLRLQLDAEIATRVWCEALARGDAS